MSPLSHRAPPGPALCPWATSPPECCVQTELAPVLKSLSSASEAQSRICLYRLQCPSTPALPDQRFQLRSTYPAQSAPTPPPTLESRHHHHPSRRPRVRSQSSGGSAVTEACVGWVPRTSPHGRTRAHTRRDRSGGGPTLSQLLTEQCTLVTTTHGS